MDILRPQFLLMYIAFGTTLTSAYPNGAPTLACESLRPGHVQGDGVPIEPQPESTFPFKLEISKNSNIVKAGDSMEIKLTSNFQGFLIQARQDNSIIGTFEVSGDESVQTRNCGTGQNNAITHTTPTVKESITAAWAAPDDFDSKKGMVEFHVTVAKTHDEFWADHVYRI